MSTNFDNVKTVFK